MDDLIVESIDDDGSIDQLTKAILAGFETVAMPEDVAAYESVPLAIALRNPSAGTDPSGGIEGGLIGHSVWDWLYIRYLWVKDTRRGGGFGMRLMQAAETEATKRYCIGIFVST